MLAASSGHVADPRARPCVRNLPPLSSRFDAVGHRTETIPLVRGSDLWLLEERFYLTYRILEQSHSRSRLLRRSVCQTCLSDT